MRFTKLQATGNDFVLVEARGMRRDWTKLSRAICDRRFGVGSDGLILLLPSRAADFRMRMLNPDGSEAEVCGNGLRCLARYVTGAGLSDARRGITVQTPAGIKAVVPRGRGRRFQVDMGRPGLRPADLPVAVVDRKAPVLDHRLDAAGRRLEAAFVSMGNPHAVHFVSNVVAFPLGDVGPVVEHHPLFPRRANFEIARVVSRGEIEARVWERGAGETMSCGSGACAVAVAALLRGYVDSPVDIKLPGGTLTVRWDRKGSVYLTGPAELVFTGEWPGGHTSEEK